MTENHEIRDFVIDGSPLAAFFAIFAFFSFYHLPIEGYAATATSPAGLLTSNFVWDSSWNVPFIYSALAIVVLAAIRSQTRRRLIAFSYPFVTIASAVVANWLLFQTPYVRPPYCIHCMVVGMSTVASASVGAALVVSFAYLLISLTGVRGGFRNLGETLFVPIALFVASLTTLFLFLQSFFFGVPGSAFFSHATSFILGCGIMATVVWSHGKLCALFRPSAD